MEGFPLFDAGVKEVIMLCILPFFSHYMICCLTCFSFQYLLHVSKIKEDDLPLPFLKFIIIFPLPLKAVFFLSKKVVSGGGVPKLKHHY